MDRFVWNEWMTTIGLGLSTVVDYPRGSTRLKGRSVDTVTEQCRTCGMAARDNGSGRTDQGRRLNIPSLVEEYRDNILRGRLSSPTPDKEGSGR